MIKLSSTNSLRLIKFYTPWCTPCKVMTNILKEVDLTDVELIEIDAESETGSELAKGYGISSVPVLVLEVNGVEVERINGVASPEDIEEMLNRR